jgi:hypothetical protein
MANAAGWIRRHPGMLVLLAALLIGQVGQRLAAPYVAEPVRADELPVVAASVLAVAVLLAIVVVVVRVRLGTQMLAGMRARSLSLPAPESLPARYAVDDPPRQAVAGTMALVDIVLLLLILSTLRGPVLALVGDFLTPEQAEMVFVAVLVLLSLVALVKLYRTGGPVLVLLLWWGLDRVVPTAGFLGARPSVAPALARPGRQQLPAAPTVVASKDTPYAPTVVAGQPTTYEPTVVAPDAGRPDATIVAPLGRLEPTSLPQAPGDAREDMTIIAPLAPHAPPPKSTSTEVDIHHDATVIVPPSARRDADTPASDAPAANAATNLDGPTIVTGPHPEADKP